MEYQLFLDTNALLNLGASAFKEHFVVAQKTLEEIEKIKGDSHKDGEVKYKARECSRLLNVNYGNYTVIPETKEIRDIIESFYLEATPDNIILASAYYYGKEANIIVCTDDLNCTFISREIFKLPTRGIDTLNLVRNFEEYKGFKDITLSDEEMSNFYCSTDKNHFNSLINEYLILRKSDGEVVDHLKWNGSCYKHVKFKQINSQYVGKIKPKNPEQVLAFDMLQDENITIKVLAGRMGSGKSLTAIANAINQIHDGKYDKLLYVRNLYNVKDTVDIGALPGTKEEKISWGAAPLADHLGGQTGLDIQIMSGTIEIENLGFIRGRDIKNTIIYCSECENLTKEQVQLLIGRVGEGSSIWLDGDYKQVDSPTFRTNNGLLSVVSKLAGHPKFGYVQLQKTERSETAAMADLLD